MRRLTVLLAISGILATVSAQDPRFDEVMKRSVPQGPLLVRYTVTLRNLLPKHLLEQKMAAEIAATKREWTQAGHSPDDSARFEAGIRARYVRIRKLNVTFASDGAKLYYLEEPMSGDPAQRITGRFLTYYDGRRTYRLLGRTLRIKDRRSLSSFQYFPAFGISVFGVAMFASPPDASFYAEYNLPDKPYRANVFWTGPSEDKFNVYVPGYVELSRSADDSYQLARLSLLHPNKPIDTIEFNGYMPRWLGMASKTTITSFFVPPGESFGSKTKERQITYELVSVERKFASFDRDALRELLRFGDPVVLEPAQGSQITLLYNLQDERIAQWLPPEPRSRLIGRVVLGCLTALATWTAYQFFVRRGQVAKKAK